jgi:hypothetical protein
VAPARFATGSLLLVHSALFLLLGPVRLAAKSMLPEIALILPRQSIEIWLAMPLQDLLRDVLRDTAAVSLLDQVLAHPVSASYVAIALLAFLSAMASLSSRPYAWTAAMWVEGLALLAGLVQYFSLRPAHTYVLLAYGVLFVFYLCLPGVRARMRHQPAPHGRDNFGREAADG